MSGDKLFERECDGIHHLWSYSRPIVCKGCGVKFTDLEALKREIKGVKLNDR